MDLWEKIDPEHPDRVTDDDVKSAVHSLKVNFEELTRRVPTTRGTGDQPAGRGGLPEVVSDRSREVFAFLDKPEAGRSWHDAASANQIEPKQVLTELRQAHDFIEDWKSRRSAQG